MYSHGGFIGYLKKMTTNQIVYLWPHISLLILKNMETTMHSHYALELYLGMNSSFQLDFGGGFKKYECCIVNSNIPHRFSGSNGLTIMILVNPNHQYAGKLAETLCGKRHEEPDILPFREIIKCLDTSSETPFSCLSASLFVKTLLNTAISTGNEIHETDERIKKVMYIIRQSFRENIRLSDLSEEVFLSESRLRHQPKSVSIRLDLVLRWTYEYIL